MDSQCRTWDNFRSCSAAGRPAPTRRHLITVVIYDTVILTTQKYIISGKRERLPVLCRPNSDNDADEVCGNFSETAGVYVYINLLSRRNVEEFAAIHRTRKNGSSARAVRSFPRYNSSFPASRRLSRVAVVTFA